MFDNIDLLIVGAGPTGCVIAERAARELGWRSLIVERRDHVGGACHDRLHISGIRVHPYGRHFFRTSDSDLLEYLSRYTRWRSTRCEVRALVDGELYPFPVNLETLERFFGGQLDVAAANGTRHSRDLPFHGCATNRFDTSARIGECRDLFFGRLLFLATDRLAWTTVTYRPREDR